MTAVSAELGYFSPSAEGTEAKGGANRKEPRRRSEPRILHHTPLPQSDQQSSKSLLSLADAIKEHSPSPASAQIPLAQGNIPTMQKSRWQKALDRQVHLFCKATRLPWISRHCVPLRLQSLFCSRLSCRRRYEGTLCGENEPLPRVSRASTACNKCAW